MAVQHDPALANTLSSAVLEPPKLPCDQQADAHESRSAIGQINAQLALSHKYGEDQQGIALASILRLGIQQPEACNDHGKIRGIRQPRLHYGTTAERRGNQCHTSHINLRAQIGGNGRLRRSHTARCYAVWLEKPINRVGLEPDPPGGRMGSASRGIVFLAYCRLLSESLISLVGAQGFEPWTR